ncbi:MAG: hypothetical protein WBM14_10430, partial [Terracidiphilus sp.]
IQIVLVSIVTAVKGNGRVLNRVLYESLGCAKKMIGRFLMDQLEALGRQKNESLRILPTLVSSKRKVARTIEYIASQTGLHQHDIEQSLQSLTDHRLVRSIEDKWELVHDYLAEAIANELISPEEKDIAILRDVLYAKAAAYRRTGELLTPREYIGIYSSRYRIRCDASELELLYHSLRGGLLHYFLKSASTETLNLWLRNSTPSDPESTPENRGDPWEGDETPDRLELLEESGQWIEPRWCELDDSLQDNHRLIRAFRAEEAEVSGAALEAIITLDLQRQSELIDILARSRTSRDLRALYRIVCDRHTDGLGTATLSSKPLKDRVLIYLGAARTLDSAAVSYLSRQLTCSKSNREKEAAAFALGAWAQEVDDKEFLKGLLAGDGPTRRGTLLSLDGRRANLEVDLLLSQFEAFPYEVASAVWRTVREEDWFSLGRFLKKIVLTPRVRNIVLALSKIQSIKALPFLMELIAEADYKVDLGKFRGVELILAAGIDVGIRVDLEGIINTREYWEWTDEAEEHGHIDIALRENLYLYKRLVGVAFGRIAGPGDWDLLKRLAFHPYFPVRDAAIGVILQFAGERELDEITELARNQVESSSDLSIGRGEYRRFFDAIRFLDRKVYSDWRGRVACSAE